MKKLIRMCLNFVTAHPSMRLQKRDLPLFRAVTFEFVNRDENIDFDTKMKTLQSELRDLLIAEEKSRLTC